MKNRRGYSSDNRRIEDLVIRVSNVYHIIIVAMHILNLVIVLSRAGGVDCRRGCMLLWACGVRSLALLLLPYYYYYNLMLEANIMI